MKQFNRRDFVKLAAATGTVMVAGLSTSQNALAGDVRLQEGGRDFSPSPRKRE